MWYAIIFGYVLPVIVCNVIIVNKTNKPYIRSEEHKKQIMDEFAPQYRGGFIPIFNIYLAIRLIFLDD